MTTAVHKGAGGLSGPPKVFVPSLCATSYGESSFQRGSLAGLGGSLQVPVEESPQREQCDILWFY